ncbi:dynamin family protein [Brachybacterium huguangmaarense]|uniref:Dynamin family protein n=1 Tax=Brachybacterium huguangmaarense TaxID=1652028 RepID=A0ABY6G1G3_9MICO|nr:dynamin family protein [Brachybacterium huguangmaarense]UYG17047.1 dynamin family protein [Brachybacterium huguangmaarense]
MRAARSGGPGLAERAGALGRAADMLDGIAPDGPLARARETVERVGGRSALSAEHTVVGVFGATGSGKSSLVNAIVGAAVTRAAVRRPTTSAPVAAVVGASGSEPLLDWLEVADRHVLEDPGTPLVRAVEQASTGRHGRRLRGVDESARPGLILLDLPDLDSVELANRETAERMTGLVDVIVWVTDPQKYADDVLHRQFVAPFAAHDATTLVVLNQVDRVRPGDRAAVLASLERLVRLDGVGSAPVLAASAETGEGVEELRERLVVLAAGREASAARLRADVMGAAVALREAAPVGELPAQVRGADVRRLVEDLGAAARVDAVSEAAARSYRHRAAGELGWPPLRWIRRLRPDPLRRLGIGQGAVPGELSRTSLPAPDAATSARASGGVRGFADATSAGAGEAWRAAVRRAARAHADELPDALDQAVAGADLRAQRRSWWWRVLGVIQWLALATAVVGLGWLTLVAVLGYLQIPAPPMPTVDGLGVPVPLPTALLVLGLGVGILLALAGGAIAALASRLERRRVRRLLGERVRAVAERLVVEPVEDVLDLGRDAATDLSLAAGDRR